ncbi:hypothetical protein AMTR_s00095p00131510 [Amborella trichopoda]|uniref:tRNA (guanine(46)-N(7))-methyltransferase n=1 Tax=Amborella trichopoda TaxID=13333 RepID=W1NU77_AMBTC|nr:hypothetical protein AMTR_s00095p00131510 [Amborella trichopoda]
MPRSRRWEKESKQHRLGVSGIVYTLTDVEELGAWMEGCLDTHPLFEPLSEEEVHADPFAAILDLATEEGTTAD